MKAAWVKYSLLKASIHRSSLPEGSAESRVIVCALGLFVIPLRLQMAQSRSCLYTLGPKVGPRAQSRPH